MACNSEWFVIEVLYVMVEMEQTNWLMIQNIHQFISPAAAFIYFV